MSEKPINNNNAWIDKHAGLKQMEPKAPQRRQFILKSLLEKSLLRLLYDDKLGKSHRLKSNNSATSLRTDDLRGRTTNVCI